MSTGRKTGALLLSAGALVITIGVVEAVFHFAVRQIAPYPGIFFQTDQPQTRLLGYDDHYNGKADFDLRRDRPFKRLKNIGNTDDDGRYNHLEAGDAPNATAIRINEFNLRERDLYTLETLQDSAVVTLVVGDSFCYGQGIPVGDRFSNLLEVRLSIGGERHAIVNGCMGGMDISGIPAMTGRLVRVLGNVEQVIYAYNMNDAIQDSSLRELARQSRQTQLFLNDANSSWIDHDGRVPVPDDRYFEWAKPFLRIWKSPFLLWLLERVGKQQLTQNTLIWYDRMYNDNAGWTKTRAHLLKLRDYCSARGIDLTLVLFPVFFDLETYPLQRVHVVVRRFANSNGIPVLDLLPLFAGKEASDYWVHPRDFHPNGRAHQEVADFLYSALWADADQRAK